MPYINLADYAATQAWQQEAENKKILQQQLFERQQNEYNRSTLTEYERQNLARQDQVHQDALDEIAADQINKGNWVKDTPPQTLPAGNVSGSSLNVNGQAQNQPPVGVNNPAVGNGAPGLGSILFGKANGSLTPTSATASQGQTGALGQSSQGTVLPSQTGAGQTGHDSGPLPPATPAGVSGGNAQPNGMSPAQRAVQPPQLAPRPGSLAERMQQGGYRWATPEEKLANATKAKIADAQATSQARIQATEDYIKTLDPKAADPAYLESLRRQAALPDSTDPQVDQRMARDYYNAVQSGDNKKAQAVLDAISKLNEAKRSGEASSAGKTIPYIHTDPVTGKQSMRMVGDQDTVDPKYDIPYEKPGGDKQPTPVIGFTQNPNGSFKSLTIHGNESNLPPDLKSLAGINSEDVKTDTERKAPAKAANDAKNAYNEAQQFARMQNGPGDVALIMQVMGQVKPENLSKIRFNKAEQDFMINARSTPDALQARLDKVRTGNLLGKEERQQYLSVLGTIAHAKAREAGLEDENGNPIGQGPVQPTTQTTPPPPPPNLPRPLTKGQKIDKATAQKYIDAFKDHQAARDAIINGGWTIPDKF